MIAGIRLRAGRAGSGRGAASRSPTPSVWPGLRPRPVSLVRGDSAYGHSGVVRACQRAGARFSLVLVKNRSVTRAIAAIPEDAWTPVQYPGAVSDPDTGEWISDAEVAEVPTFTTRSCLETTPTPPASQRRRTAGFRAQPQVRSRTSATCAIRSALGPRRGSRKRRSGAQPMLDRHAGQEHCPSGADLGCRAARPAGRIDNGDVLT